MLVSFINDPIFNRDWICRIDWNGWRVCVSLCLGAIIVGVLLRTCRIRWCQERSDRLVSLLEGEGQE